MFYNTSVPRALTSGCYLNEESASVTFLTLIPEGKRTIKVEGSIAQFRLNNCSACEKYFPNAGLSVHEQNVQVQLAAQNQHSYCSPLASINCLKNYPLLETEEIEIDFPSMIMTCEYTIPELASRRKKRPVFCLYEAEPYNGGIGLVPYRVSNVSPDGAICWGKKAYPKNLRMAYSQLWNGVFTTQLANYDYLRTSLKEAFLSYVNLAYEEGKENHKFLSTENTLFSFIFTDGVFVATEAHGDYWRAQLAEVDCIIAADKPIVGFYTYLPKGKGAIISIENHLFVREANNWTSATGKAIYIGSKDTFLNPIKVFATASTLAPTSCSHTSSPSSALALAVDEDYEDSENFEDFEEKLSEESPTLEVEELENLQQSEQPEQLEQSEQAEQIEQVEQVEQVEQFEESLESSTPEEVSDPAQEVYTPAPFDQSESVELIPPENTFTPPLNPPVPASPYF